MPNPTSLIKPVAESYWVIPDRLLAGKHPGGRNPQDVERRLGPLLAAGFNAFIDLTEPGEMPPYDPYLPEDVDYARKSIPDSYVSLLGELIGTKTTDRQNAVAFTDADRGSQWPGSRVISAQKANTANAFSLPGLALSTANLWAAVQPGGSLFGLQESNPVETGAAYQGPSSKFGTAGDPLVGQKIGGINVFGGGLALYNASHVLVGGIGVSGDTSCADHNIAWRTRHTLNLDFVPGGVGPAGRRDNINYQTLVPVPSLQNDFSHPICSIAGVDGVSAISAALPVTQ